MPVGIRACLGFALTLAFLTSAPAALAQHPKIERLRAAAPKVFSDKQIARGFFGVAFGAELGLAGRVDRIRKYEKPVRVKIDGLAAPERRAILVKVIEDIQRRVTNLDIEMADDKERGNFAIHLVREKDLPATVRKVYGKDGQRILRKLKPQCLSGIRKDDNYRITGSDVIILGDAGLFDFYDCAYEEILQALGPIRDDPTVPWTIFNDNVELGYFGLYDQYLLNILYHERVRAGMTRAEIRKLLPRIMPEVRALVARNNRPRR